MKERWILSGEFMNGDKYFESFDSIFDMTDVMNQVYNEWISSNGLDQNNTVNPFVLQVENDNTPSERRKLLKVVQFNFNQNNSEI